MRISQISAYPGNIARANFFNYEPQDSDLKKFGFVVSGANLTEDVEISFWDLQRDCEITWASTLVVGDPPTFGDFGNGDTTIQGTVTIPGPGMYQLILKNPHTRKEAQSYWIFLEGSVCEECT